YCEDQRSRSFYTRQANRFVTGRGTRDRTENDRARYDQPPRSAADREWRLRPTSMRAWSSLIRRACCSRYNVCTTPSQSAAAITAHEYTGPLGTLGDAA